MEQSPSWEANSDSIKKLHTFNETRRFITVFTTARTGPYPEPHVPSLYIPPCFHKIHSNIILHSTRGSPEMSRPQRLPNQNIVRISHRSHACCIPHPSHPPWCDLPRNISWTVEFMKLLIMQSSPASHLVTYIVWNLLPPPPRYYTSASSVSISLSELQI
jgi:hypothetical protein